MKILHIVHGFLPECRGGTEFHVDELSRAQARAGHEVFVVSGSLERGVWNEDPAVRGGVGKCDSSWSDPEGDVAGFDEDGAGAELGDGAATCRGEVRRIRLKRSDLYFDSWCKAYSPEIEIALRRLLDTLRPDLVHVHHWIRLTVNLVRIATDLGFPAVITLHDLYATCPRCFRLLDDGSFCTRPMSPDHCLTCAPRFPLMDDDLTREGLKLYRDSLLDELNGAGAVLVPTACTADLIARCLEMPRERFKVTGLPYAPRLSGGPRKPYTPHQAGKVLRIGTWGVISEHKGAELLIDALRRVHADGSSPLELRFFGRIATPKLERRLRKKAEGLPVTFNGPYTLEEVDASAPHVAVFSSQAFETYGFVLDEAFEMGLPVIVPDHGALNERAGAAGHRFRVNDAESLADTIRHVSARPEVLARAASRIPPPSEMPEHYAKRLHAIYIRIMKSSCGRKGAPSPVTPLRRLNHEFRIRDRFFAEILRFHPIHLFRSSRGISGVSNFDPESDITSMKPSGSTVESSPLKRSDED